MPKKSVRVNSGLGGKPNRPVRHTTSNVNDIIPEVTVTHSVEAIIEEEGDIRETIRKALLDNLPNLSSWLSRVGEDDPLKGLTAFRDFAEFILPKLQRTDSKLDTASPLQLNLESISSFKKRKEQKEEQDGKRPITAIPG